MEQERLQSSEETPLRRQAIWICAIGAMVAIPIVLAVVLHQMLPSDEYAWIMDQYGFSGFFFPPTDYTLFYIIYNKFEIAGLSTAFNWACAIFSGILIYRIKTQGKKHLFFVAIPYWVLSVIALVMQISITFGNTAYTFNQLTLLGLGIQTLHNLPAAIVAFSALFFGFLIFLILEIRQIRANRVAE